MSRAGQCTTFHARPREQADGNNASHDPAMPDNACPSCSEPLTAGDINIAEGVALCKACGRLSRLSEVVEGPALSPTEVATPPHGCAWHDDGRTITVEATCRSPGGAIAALFICLFWNGIVSVFVLIALAGLYTNLVGPLPAWFPAPSMKGGPGGSQTGAGMPLGMSIFLCIFLIPFLAVGALIFAGFLLCLAGRVTVKLEAGAGSIRTGLGRIARTRVFDATAVKAVRLNTETTGEQQNRKTRIVIEADKPVKFGSILSDERRKWMCGMLRVLLVGNPRASSPSR